MIDLLRTRRTIRKYKNQKIEAGNIEVLKESLLRSPSARGLNGWTFIFVDKPDILKKLSECKEQGSAFLKDAALGIVMCGDENIIDLWIENCTIASTMVQLTAHSLGLGSCWIQIRNRMYKGDKPAEQYIQELLGIPKNLKIECIISIGYPDENKNPYTKDDLDFSRIKYNHY